MKELSFQIKTIIERAYDSQKECEADEIDMKEKNFEVIGYYHDVYAFYRKYQNIL